jgi:hypothetical protein
MDMRAKAIGRLILAVLAVGCMPGVDLSQLHPEDGGSYESETVGDGVDLGDRADAADGDADSADTDGLDPDVDAIDDAGTANDDVGDTEVDTETGADGDADADTDVPACDPSACSGACSSSGYPGGRCSGPTCICDPICVPDCVGRECGDDGCGTPCSPGCGATERCTATRHCWEIVDDCGGADPTAACQAYCNSVCGFWSGGTWYVYCPDPYSSGPTGMCCPPEGCTVMFTPLADRLGCWCMCVEMVHSGHMFCREPPPEG